MLKVPFIAGACLAVVLSACNGDAVAPDQQLPLLKQGAPGAPPPDVFKGSNEPTAYPDDVLCQYPPFNFDVDVKGTDTYTITIYYNLAAPPDNISKITFQDRFLGTVTGPTGVVLRKQSAGNTIYDYDGGTDTFKGLAAKYQPLNGGPPIDVDAGYIKFDEFLTVLKEGGKHPLFMGPGNDAVCNALVGN